MNFFARVKAYRTSNPNLSQEEAIEKVKEQIAAEKGANSETPVQKATPSVKVVESTSKPLPKTAPTADTEEDEDAQIERLERLKAEKKKRVTDAALAQIAAVSDIQGKTFSFIKNESALLNKAMESGGDVVVVAFVSPKKISRAEIEEHISVIAGGEKGFVVPPVMLSELDRTHHGAFSNLLGEFLNKTNIQNCSMLRSGLERDVKVPDVIVSDEYRKLADQEEGRQTRIISELLSR